ncbi:MAG: polyferredoxin, partial [Myxococcota bacterium]
DACTDVMGKLGHESLISYTTIAQTQGQPHRILRPRTISYAALLGGIAAAFLFLAVGRDTLDATINRAPGSLYTLDEDGAVRNTFLLQVTSKRTGAVAPIEVTLDGIPGAELVVPPMTLEGGGVKMLPLVIRIPPDAIESRTTPVELTVTVGEDIIELHTTFKSNTELEG